MAKDKLTEYSATNASNDVLGDISVAEGMLPSAVNNAIREQMTHLKNFADGTDGINVLSLEDDDGSHAVKLQAPSTVSTTVTYTLPGTDGTSGYVLTTNGSGALSWAASLSNVVEDTSPQLGGNLDTNGNDITFGDNDKAIFGAGSDLQIYHDGSNSYISDEGTGDLNIRASDDLRLQVNSGGSFINSIICNDAAAVDLYHNNNLKLATTATGVDVTGVITTDGMTTSADINFGDADYAYFGASNDLKIGHTGSASVIQETGTGDLFLDATNFQIRSGDGSETLATLTTDGAVTLYHNNAAKLATTSSGVSVTGTVAATSFTGDGSSLTGIAAGATGGGSDQIFYENGQAVTTNYTITDGKNAMSAGPITINSGITVTVGTGETWTVV